MCNCGTRMIYTLGSGTSGVRNREWHATEPAIPISQSTTEAGRNFRLGHDFSSSTTVDTPITNLNLNDTDNTAGELDVQVLDTVITVPSGSGLWVQYSGGSEGYWAIEVGQCCGPFELRDELGYADRIDNIMVVGPVFLPPGQHNFRAWNIDSGGTNSSHQVSYSTDGATFNRVLPDGVTLTLDKRPVVCLEIPSCQAVPENWDICPPQPCGGEAVDPAPSTALTVEDVLALIPTPVLCTGRKFWTSNPTGWLGITSGNRVPAGWTYVVPQWRTILTATSPDCVSEMATTIDLGHALHYMRRARLYHLGEVRILVNGAAIRTYTSRTYNYSDERSDTNPDVIEPQQYEWKHLGVDKWSRQNIAPGSIVELQVAHRVREAAPQSDPYSKAYVGLRSQGQVIFTPETIQTGVTP